MALADARGPALEASVRWPSRAKTTAWSDVRECYSNGMMESFAPALAPRISLARAGR
jgi:hypothetical protein